MELAKRLQKRETEEKKVSDNDVSESGKRSVNEVASFEKQTGESPNNNLLQAITEIV